LSGTRINTDPEYGAEKMSCLKHWRYRSRQTRVSFSPLDFERFEERNLLAVTASFNFLSGVLSVTGSTDSDTITVSRSTAGHILVNGNTVGSTFGPATIASTQSISIDSSNSIQGQDKITFDFTNGPLAPGRGIEATDLAEIEINVKTAGQDLIDDLTIIGLPGSDFISMGTAGINLNGDGDVDITLAGIESMKVFGGTGDDHILAVGGSLLGDQAIFLGLAVFGGSGNDFLIGGASLTTHLFGGDGSDQLIHGRTGGNADGGEGTDTFFLTGTAQPENVELFRAGVSQTSYRVSGPAGANQLGVLGEIETIRYTSEGGDLVDMSQLSRDDRQAIGLSRIVIALQNGANDVKGSGGNDEFEVNGGTNRISGLGGNDVFRLRGGTNNLLGNAGDDLFVVTGGSNSISGGRDTDRLDFEDIFFPGLKDFVIFDRDHPSNSLDIQIRENSLISPVKGSTRATSVEGLEVRGGFGDDHLDLTLLSVDDLAALRINRVLIDGGDGNDTIFGSMGVDVIDGGTGNDAIAARAGDDVIRSGAGNDVVRGNTGNDLIFGGDGNDQLFGGEDNDRIFGENGSDILDGGPGDNFLDEGQDPGGIAIRGTDGHDVIFVGRQVINNVPHALVIINGIVTRTPYLNGETMIVYAGAGNDVVTLDASLDNRWSAEFHGEDGNDVLFGGPRADKLFGGDGNDVLYGFGDNDMLLGEAGNDWLFGGLDNDVLIGGSGEDWLYGESGRDLLVAGHTTLDSSPEPLPRIMQEWSSGAPYAQRVANVLGGTGPALSGSGTRLRRGITLFDDSARDRLFGGLDEDLFFSDPLDLNSDRIGHERME
jgi:Ca2+-binding RTX toxin-like protein